LRGGAPNMRRYSRLNWNGLGHEPPSTLLVRRESGDGI